MKKNPWRFIEEPFNEKIKKNSFTNMLHFALTLPLVFIITPMIIQYTGREAYGIWAITGAVLVFLEYMALQTPAAVNIDVPRYNPKTESEKINETLNTLFVFFLALAAAAALLFVFFKEDILSSFFRAGADMMAEASFVLSFSVFAWLFNLVLLSFAYLSGGLNTFYPCSILRIFIGYIRVGLMAAALLAGYGIKGVAVVQMGTIILETLLIIVWMKIIFPPLSFNPFLFRLEKLGRLVKLGVKLVAIRLAGAISLNADKLILGYFLNPVYVAYYQIGAGISRYVSAIPEIIGSASLAPAVSGLKEKNETQRIFGVFDRMLKYILTGGVFVAAGIIFFGREFIYLWLGEGYETSYRVMSALAAAYCAGLIVIPMQHILNGLEKMNRLMAVAAVSAVLNIGLSVYLTSKYGINGALVGTAAAITAGAIMTYVLFWKVTGHRLRHKELFVMPVLSAFAAYAPVFVFMEIFPGLGASWPVFIVKAFLFSALFAVFEMKVFRHIDEYDTGVMRRFLKKESKAETP